MLKIALIWIARILGAAIASVCIVGGIMGFFLELLHPTAHGIWLLLSPFIGTAGLALCVWATILQERIENARP